MSHSKTTELEREVPIDSDNSTSAPPAQPEEASAPDDAVADGNDNGDVHGKADAADEAEQAETAKDPAGLGDRFSWKRMVACGLLPALALALGSGAGYLKWQSGKAELSRAAAAQSTQAASENTIAMLSYRPDTVDKDLVSAANRMTGKFRDDYTRLISDVVIPGAKQRKISAVAKVSGVASVSATENHAVVLAFVDQTVTVGDDAPTDTASTVRVILDKINGRWLISQFEPI